MAEPYKIWRSKGRKEGEEEGFELNAIINFSPLQPSLVVVLCFALQYNLGMEGGASVIMRLLTRLAAAANLLGLS